MFKRTIIKILLRLLGENIDYNEIEDKKIVHWLQSQYSDMGFRDYFRKRDLALLKAMGIGLARDNYLIVLGKRLELMALLQSVDKAYKTRSKKVERKISSNNKGGK